MYITASLVWEGGKAMVELGIGPLISLSEGAIPYILDSLFKILASSPVLLYPLCRDPGHQIPPLMLQLLQPLEPWGGPISLCMTNHFFVSLPLTPPISSRGPHWPMQKEPIWPKRCHTHSKQTAEKYYRAKTEAVNRTLVSHLFKSLAPFPLKLIVVHEHFISIVNHWHSHNTPHACFHNNNL